jgi:nucleoside-diphosphate-sugar epimerase
MQKNKRILITGSAGFLGSSAFRYFQSSNYDVVGVDVINRPASVTQVMDIRDYVKLSKDRFDVILHFAAEVKGRDNIECNYLKMVENIEIDRVVFKWAMTHATHIIYPSSCATYPVQYQRRPGVPLYEGMVDFKNELIGVSDHLYGWTKLTAERMLWQMHQETGQRIHVLRPFSGYGPGQSLDYPMANLLRIIKQTPNELKVWGNGQQTRDWVHVNDILKTVEWCLNDAQLYRTVNIGTGVATTFKDLIREIFVAVYDREPGDIECLANRPSGMPHRVADTRLQKQLDIMPTITLAEGIRTLL